MNNAIFTADSSAEIYEYNGFFWFIEKSSQNWPRSDGPTERVRLTGALPLDASTADMGELCLLTLMGFNSTKPPFLPWEQKELRKLFCSWVGARSWSSFYKNARYVWVGRCSSVNEVQITPVDNCNIYPHESAIEKAIINVEAGADPRKLGRAVLDAFKSATNHPERKL